MVLMGHAQAPDAEIMRLTGELVQEAVSFELQQVAKTARATLETEKKQVEGELLLSILCLLLGFTRSVLDLFSFLLSGLRMALGTSVTQVEALQVAYNSSQQELEVLQEVALEACQSVNEGARLAGSSVVSRFRALGGHIARRMRDALRLGI
jgi:hypothetical protein